MQVDRKAIRRIVLGGFILFFLIYLYLFSGQIFLNACKPLFIGIAMAYIMNIMIGWFLEHDILYNRKILKSEKIHTILSTVLAVAVLILALTVIFGYIAPQLTACVITLMDKVPSGIRILLNSPIIIRLIPDDTMETLQQIDWTKWLNHLVSIVNSDDLIQGMTSTATSALSVFSTLMFGIMFACYFTAGRKRRHEQMTRALRAFLSPEKERIFFHYSGMLNSCFHDFIVCQSLQALILGLASTAFLLIFRFPYATMIGVLNGFCALLPVIGGYIGAILGTLIILADSPQMALMFLILIIVIQNVVGTLVFPRLVGRSLGLPAVWTLAAVTVGSGMVGITGIIIGVPLAAFAYRSLAEEVRRREEAQERLAEAEQPEAPEKAAGAEKAAAKAKPAAPGTAGKQRKGSAPEAKR